MMTKNEVGILALTPFILLLCSCSPATSGGNVSTLSTTITPHTVEPIYGFEAQTTALQFVVRSNGCTDITHFDLLLSEATDEDYAVTLVRNKRDKCKAMPKMLTLQLPLERRLTTASKLVLNNPFAVKRRGN